MKSDAINTTVYPLTPAQLDLSYDEFALGKNSVNNINALAFYVWIDKEFDAQALENAFWKVIEVNDALRLKIFKEGFKYFQYIKDHVKTSLPRYNFVTREEFDREVSDYVDRTYISICDDNLVAAELLIGENGNGGIVVRMHHACSDGTSMGILFSQFDKFYNAYKNNEDLSNVKTYSIVKYFESCQQYIDDKCTKKDFLWWVKKYNTQKKYSIPAGRRESKDCRSSTEAIRISDDTYEKLTQLCRDCGCSVQSVLMTLASVSTWIISGKENFCFFTMSHGRNTIPLKRTVGCMVNTVPVFFYVKKDTNLKEFLGSSYLDYLETISHSRIPFKYHIIASYLQSVRCGFNFVHSWMEYSAMDFANVLSKLSIEANVVKKEYSCCPFYCGALDVTGKYAEIFLEYQIKKFKKEDIIKWLEIHKTVITCAANEPDIDINTLKTKVLKELNK